MPMLNPALPLLLPAFLLLASPARAATADFQKDIRPLLNEFCLKCHSSKDHKGDRD